MPARPRERFDSQALALNTFASLSGAILSSALGASELGSLICAVIAPALTALVIHPGPHRRRRLALVAALLALLHLIQSALARVRGRNVRSRTPWTGLRFSGLTACIAVAISVMLLTAPELVLGDSFVSDRRLTLFPVGRREPPPRPTPTPTATATPEPATTPKPRKPTPKPRKVDPPKPRALDPQGPPPDRTAPALNVPSGVAARASDGRGAVVRYPAGAVDAVDGAVSVSCRPASGSRFPVGTTTVRCSARDRAGNVATDSFEVRVTAPPAVTPRPAPPKEKPKRPQLPDRPQLPNRPQLPERPQLPDRPQVPDPPREKPAPEPPPPPEETPPAPEVPNPDVTPPVFTGPRLIIVDTQERDGVRIPYPPPPATDGRGGPVPARCTPRFVPAGSRIQVQCMATDRAGNTAQATFTVWARIS